MSGRAAIAAIAALVVFLAGGAPCDAASAKAMSGFPSFADLADRVKPAVVNIAAEVVVTVPGNPFRHFFGSGEKQQFGDFFDRYFREVPDRKMKQQSLGSGFIIDPDGFIVTNNHVVEKAEEIRVRLSDGREFTARVVGRDPKTDLALIKISSPFHNLPVLPLGNSDKARVGDWVLAVGNPFGLEQTVTQGIISATARVIGSGPYDDFLQTDAAINPGNSGGPLLNLQGEVVGINSAIVAGGQGIGFAVPSNLAKSVAAQLKSNGRVVRGFIGASIQTVTPELAKSFGLPEAKGALVADVVEGSPAAEGGVRSGDVIVSFDGRKIEAANDLPRVVAETALGKEAAVELVREGKRLQLKVKVAEMQDEQPVSAEPPAEGPKLGIMAHEITPELRDQLRLKEKTGLVVVQIDPSGPAAAAGVQPRDVILQANRTAVKTVADLQEAVAKTPQGEAVLLLINRGGQKLFISVKP